MTRHMLIRAENQAAHVVAEAALPTEAELHDALTNHPQLIPAADIGLGDTLVVGRESGLAAGYADLVLLDDRGRLCIVEVKNEGNPDTRRVVAQLLDYAASLGDHRDQIFTDRAGHRAREKDKQHGEKRGDELRHICRPASAAADPQHALNGD